MIGVLRRNPQFRVLWMAQVVSQSGDWLNRMAVLALIGRLSGPEATLGMGALFGVELALRLLPSAFFGPFAGPVADRLPRRSLMIAADLARSGVVLCYLLVDTPEELPLLYALLAAQMSASIFFNAARSASIPNTVGPDDLHAAYALSAATWSAMLTIGALGGGLLVEIIGVRGVFIADALTYVGSATLLFTRLRLPPVPVQAEPFRWRDIFLLTDLRRGWRHVSRKRLLPVLLSKTFWGPAGGFLVLLSVAGNSRYGGGTGPGAAGTGAAALAIGVLYSARGLGTGLGPVLARRYMGSSDRALRRQIASGFFLAAAGYVFFGWINSLVLAFLFVTIAHMGGSTLWVASTTFWQKQVDDAFRGRVYALEFLGMTVAFSAGGLLAGWIYDLSGSVEATTWSVCAMVLLSGLAWMAWARTVPVGDGSAPAAAAPSAGGA